MDRVSKVTASLLHPLMCMPCCYGHGWPEQRRLRKLQLALRLQVMDVQNGSGVSDLRPDIILETDVVDPDASKTKQKNAMLKKNLVNCEHAVPPSPIVCISHACWSSLMLLQITVPA